MPLLRRVVLGSLAVVAANALLRARGVDRSALAPDAFDDIEPDDLAG
jgi:hypothetical protein